MVHVNHYHLDNKEAYSIEHLKFSKNVHFLPISHIFMQACKISFVEPYIVLLVLINGK
jgi:hypothetical protein